MKTRTTAEIIVFAAVLTISHHVNAQRIKDISDIAGARHNQLVGYGIVVGLAGTGDGTGADFTLKSVASMLRRLGVQVDHNKIKPKNAAAVIVTADLPPFARNGQKLDVVVSSLGDAKSLRGGTLIQTPLQGADRQVYAVAQGAISIGGFSAGGSGASKSSGHTTVGRIPSGGLIERQVNTSIETDNVLRITLKSPDPVTAHRTTEIINQTLGGPFATAVDPGLIKVLIPPNFRDRTVELLSVIGDLQVETDHTAKIVINERSGTVVIGSAVRLKPAAIAHGSLTVEISKTVGVSQPPALSGGSTVQVEETELKADFAPGNLHFIPGASTVSDLVGGLNSLGVKPSDLIVIFQMLKAAGAITAEIEVQ